MHVETVRERSEPRDWTIGTHVHGGLAQVIAVLSGGVTATLDGGVDHHRAPAALAVPAGAVHGFRFDVDTDGYVISLADGQIDSSPLGGWVRAVLFERGARVALDAATAERVADLCALAEAEHAGAAPGSDVVVASLVEAVVVLVARSVMRAGDEPAGVDVDRSSRRVYREFRDLVEEHHAEQWAPRRYASHLGVSPSTLDRAARHVAGCSAFEVAQARLELEALRRLRYTAAPVHQIATQLGFADASYFSRFIRRRTGRSPSAHRAG